MKKIITFVMVVMMTSALWAQNSGLTISYKDGNTTKEQTFNLDSVSSFGYNPTNRTVFVQPFIGAQLSIPYQNLITFVFPPINNYGIDVEATKSHGGLLYHNAYPNEKYVLFVYDRGIKVYYVEEKSWATFPHVPNWRTLDKPFTFIVSNYKVFIGAAYLVMHPGLNQEMWEIQWNDGDIGYYEKSLWTYPECPTCPHNGSPSIPCTVTTNPDGSVTVAGSGVEVTAREW